MDNNRFKSLILKFLDRTPSCFQSFLGDIRFGDIYLQFGLPVISAPIRYLKFYNFVKKSQWWSRERLEQYQLDKLRQLLKYAYENVPYYTKIFKKLNLIPEDIQSIEELEKLPVLTREDIVKNFNQLISRKASKKHLELITSSGSTGKPVQFYRDKRYNFIEWAFGKMHLDALNIKVNERYIYLSFRPFKERNIEARTLYEHYFKRLSFSTLHHSLKLYDEHMGLIKQFKPVYARGNPSMFYHLACYAQEKNIQDIKLKCFISTYENLFPYQRELIEKQFKCPSYNYYLSEERVVSAFECPMHEGLHIHMQRGILEIVGENGESLSDGQSGRIAATGFCNFAMPLIRYELGDIGSISKKPCSCGRGLVLIRSFDGRSNEVVRYKDKNIHSSILSCLLSNLYHKRNIKEYQFIQETEDKITVNIVKRSGYSEQDTEELAKILKKIIDEELDIGINFVDYIPRTRMGKFPFIISKIKHGTTRQ